MTDCYEEIIIAGFGGQGIILAGRLLAQAAMNSGREVTYMPSYGAEVRGGTAKCMVIISDKPIASPIISSPDVLIAMNKASLLKYGPGLKEGGLLVVNSSLVDELCRLEPGVKTVWVPADETAVKLGNQKSANMVMLGAYLGSRDLLSEQVAIESLPEVLAKRYHNTIPINVEALRSGVRLGKESVKS